jgi:hypothetical protein
MKLTILKSWVLEIGMDDPEAAGTLSVAPPGGGHPLHLVEAGSSAAAGRAAP